MSKMCMAAIHQPHYFPWIPYLNKLAASDTFILYDTVQLPRGKCKELRAKYLLNGAEKWLSIPAGKAKSSMAPIDTIELPGLDWKADHLNKLRNAYAKAPHKDWALGVVEKCLEGDSRMLVDIHHNVLSVLVDELDLGTRLVRASELAPFEGMSLQEYVVVLLQKAGVTSYFTGQGRGTAKTLDESLFEAAGIEILYQDYAIPRYEQPGTQEFVHTVSVLDALFMCGPGAKDVIITGQGE